MYRQFAQVAPLRRNLTIDDIGGAAVWLASDLARRVTGEVVFVDSGYNILGAYAPDEERG
jgi:enoyl-[acyl-carrier protein] reductase I